MNTIGVLFLDTIYLFFIFHSLVSNNDLFKGISVSFFPSFIVL